MNKTIFLIVIGLIVVAGLGFWLLLGNRAPEVRQTEQQIQQMMEADTTKEATEPAKFVPTGKKLAKNYYEYNETDYFAARKAGKPILLYFYANWCPTCARQEPVIVEMMNSADSKYDNIVAFRVNYNDNETDDDERKLARDFGVRYQHTMFVLDSSGDQSRRFLGDTSPSAILTAFDQVI